jgi:glycosyltransferase involved in cell wall biosynthesis
MIAAARSSGRALLRRARTGIRLAGVALDRHREFGLVDLAVRAARHARREDPDSPLAETPAPKTVFDVIYAIGYWPGEPKRYRVFNMAGALAATGYAVHVMPFDRLGDICRYRWRAATLVLFRAEYDRLAGVEEVLRYARGVGMRVVYDIDDLVFDPGFAARIDGVAAMGPIERRQTVAAMSRRRRLLLACDLVTVSTTPLARAVAQLGRPSAVVPNTLNTAQLRLAANLARQPCAEREHIWLGYFSGTPTHRRDFAVCEPALLALLRRYPEVRFRAVGHLDLGAQWEGYGDRVERIGMLNPDDLLRLIAETDINLAPLEAGNPFCEGKSELKFFEAAIVGVPTVASATEPFLAAIEDGVSGLIARHPDDWQEAIECLLLSASRRREMGTAAKLRALLRYGPGSAVPAATAALGLPGQTADNLIDGLAREHRLYP